ncbi:MAG: glycosyltransferase family 2 protein [Phascolarctobacterium sp.]|nr:glycosyltransferase family 2 protein [Phascolarctobacterium sp.]
MPEISVIIPVYNVEDWLPKCLDSVLKQTFCDFEAICINDGSPDNSLKILEQYAKSDARIKIISQKNQGLSMARNNGFLNSTGKYIYFLDSDDEIHYQTLEIVYKLSQMHNARLVCWEFTSNDINKFHNRKFDINNLDINVSHSPISLGTHKEKYSINFNVCTKLYKRELLTGIEFISGIHFEDVPHTFAILSKYPKTVVVHEQLYFYRRNPNSITNQKANPQQIKDYITGLQYIYELYVDANMHKELQFLSKNFIPNILQQQLGRCRHSTTEVKQEMWKLLNEEFIWLDSINMIRWTNHRILRCWLHLKFNI